MRALLSYRAIATILTWTRPPKNSLPSVAAPGWQACISMKAHYAGNDGVTSHGPIISGNIRGAISSRMADPVVEAPRW